MEDIDPHQPTTATLLGISVIIWKPTSSIYQVSLDRSPHRLAPVCEGKIMAFKEIAIAPYRLF